MAIVGFRIWVPCMGKCRYVSLNDLKVALGNVHQDGGLSYPEFLSLLPHSNSLRIPVDAVTILF